MKKPVSEQYKALISRHIECFRSEVKKKTGIDPDSMQHRDFLQLEEDIFTTVRIKISISTLKRLLGNIPYEGLPHPQTLDALCRYLGYKNWGHFTRKKDGGHTPFIKRKIIIISLIIILLPTSVLVLFHLFHAKNIPPYQYHISVNTAERYPAALRIDYDVHDNPDFFILFNFSRNKVGLIPEKKLFLKNLYHPGHNIATLYYKDIPLESDSFFVSTHGWITYEQTPEKTPFYSNDVLRKEGVIFNLPGHPKNNYATKLLYYDTLSQKSDNITLNTRFKVIPNKERNIQKVTIGLDFSNGMIDLGFTNPEGSVNNHLIIGRQTFSGTYNNLSLLSVNSNQWYDLQIRTHKNMIRFILNETEIFRSPYEDDLGELHGLNFHSYDTIAFDHVSLSENEKIIFEDSFE